jgi:Kdo2-lipid IVA lauroyltransferase/acyltransferase
MAAFFLKTACRLFGILPLPVALALGRGMGWVFGSVVRHHRRDAVEALKRSLPEIRDRERRQILKRMYSNLGMNVAEELRLVSLSNAYLEEHIRWDDIRPIQTVLAAGKGMLVLTGHMGNWDLLCSIAPKFNYPTTIITKTIKNNAINTVWMEIRNRFGLKFVPAHNSYRQCLSALRKNEIVGFAIDQNMIDTEGVFVDFFGKQACTTPGLAYMSAQSGAAVVPVFMIRLEQGRHLVKTLPAIPPPPDRKPETIREYTQIYTKVMEDMIRQYPDQWIWVHRRWKTVPNDRKSSAET